MARLGSVGGGAGVLDGPGDLLMEFAGGAEGPVGVAEELAGEEDEVGLAGADDLVGLGGLGDHAYGGSGKAGFAADGLGVNDLVAGAGGDLLAGVVAAGGDIYEVDAFCLQELGELDRLGEIPAWAEGLWSPVGGGDADRHRQMLRPRGAQGAGDFEREAGAVFEASAVLVGAVVRERREKLVEEIAMGGVQFDEVEAGGEGAVSGGGEVGDDLVHAGAVERGGDGVGVIEAEGGGGYGLPAAFRQWDAAGGFPGNGHAGFASGVGELGAGVGSMLMEERGDALEFGDVLVLPDAEVAGSDAGFGADGVGFGEDDGGAAYGAAAEMDEVPVVGEAAGGGVLAHGRDGDTVRKGEAAELEGAEELVRRVGHTELDARRRALEWRFFWWVVLWWFAGENGEFLVVFDGEIVVIRVVEAVSLRRQFARRKLRPEVRLYFWAEERRLGFLKERNREGGGGVLFPEDLEAGMQAKRMAAAAMMVLAIALVSGCRVENDKHGDSENVKIATPFGGMTVKTNDTTVEEGLGLPLYPGAVLVKKKGKNDGAADVNFSFGKFQLRVKAASYTTPDAPDKVAGFYRKALGRYGDVIECRNNTAVGTPTHTAEGLTCSDDDQKNHLKVDDEISGKMELKAGSKQHQHTVGIDSDGSGTKMGIVAVDLPGHFVDDDDHKDQQTQ